MNIHKPFYYSFFFTTVIVLTGCSTASTDPVRVENDFGNSVRNMVDAQKYDPDAAKTLVAEPRTGIDGVSAEHVLKDHHSSKTDGEKINEPIHLKIE